ncbi:MAG TPA: hypothetical protein VKP14_09705 [Gaiellaceae bacterium]|nr:hypothetical protein [Gaiellaceae bacterium]
MRGLEAGTVRQARRGLVLIASKLTISFQSRNGPLTGRLYRQFCEHEGTHMRLIVTLTAALTVLLLVLPAHP